MNKSVREMLLELQGETAVIIPKTGEGDAFLADVEFVSKAEDTVKLQWISPTGNKRPEIWTIDRIEEVVEI